ncbi:unnamed protein product, partial [Adineta ricciae]
YASRPALKRFERYSNNILQVTRQLNAFSNSQLRNQIFNLSEAMAVAQHHDAVSGTERQHVADDYVLRLSIGIDAALNVINQAYSKLLSKGDHSRVNVQQFLCPLTNISECLPIENVERFVVTLWNPTIHPVMDYLRVPVTNSYKVRDPNGTVINVDLIPISNITKDIPGRMSNATMELILRYNLPTLGFSSYFFERNEEEVKDLKITKKEMCILQNQYLRVEIDEQGNLQQMINLQKNINLTFANHGFYWYEGKAIFSERRVKFSIQWTKGYPGNNSQFDFQASGAYIFRPVTQNPTPVSTKRALKCFKTSLVQIALITFNEWISEEIRLYDEKEDLEIEWTVGPIPIEELLVRWNRCSTLIDLQDLCRNEE